MGTETPNVERSLDALNFFLADVRDGLGPYLAIYLLTEQKWDEASIGVVMSIAAIAGIIAQTPAGALIDRSTAKRALMVVAAILVTLSSVTLPFCIVSNWSPPRRRSRPRQARSSHRPSQR